MDVRGGRTQLPPGVAALLEGIVDYAGLFPPAQLDMAMTVRNYAQYRAGADAWMLGRLIVPAARLDELEQHAAELWPRGDDAAPWTISALLPPAGDDGLPAAIDRIMRFNEAHESAEAGLARIDVVELRAGDARAIESALDALPDELFPFFELPLDNDVRGPMAVLAGSDAGAKARTGGVTPDLYPSPEQLARFIIAAAGARVPFKATAGLHHPVRHFSPAVGAQEFGFLNVFIGAAMVFEEMAGPDELAQVLVEEDASAFSIDARGVAWRGRPLRAERVAAARQRFAISFGSCSFDEPREDLRGIGVL